MNLILQPFLQMRSCGFVLFSLCLGMFSQVLSARDVETQNSLTVSRKLDTGIDLHLTSADEPLAEGVKVELSSEDAWVFFDQMKPNDVLEKYSDQILIDGKPLVPEENGRVSIYLHGAVVMPHGADFHPLKTYTEPQFGGKSSQMACNYYYTNNPSEYFPERLVKKLPQDNSIRSFVLKRGYMATFANESDGMGYSRVFVADTADLIVPAMPDELNGKASYVRVMKWNYVSKKGWAGSIWKEMPEGLKYVGEQCDFTNCTWFYNWGASAEGTTNPNAKSKSYNQEFVPEKWGAGGDPQEFYTLEDVSHLMGYNEPDHKEQSNVSVETAIEEWPILLKTGLRLGSPATTDFNWLYDFMSEAKKRNYRVDYVVIHAYWGGLSGAEWYEKLKEVHERTGRPLWIKEWNNGANWTTEGWPSGQEAQYEKQLRDLKNILLVMDTASFIERYSIYNWVEDKRMIISNEAKLTPAGEYYTNNRPGYFFNREKEVIPTWKVRTSPQLEPAILDEENQLNLTWTDENAELVDSYTIEQSTDNKSYEPIAEVEGGNTGCFPLKIPQGAERLYFRVNSNTAYGNPAPSEAVELYLFDDAVNLPYVAELQLSEQWSSACFLNRYEEVPVAILGAPTYRNKMPLSSRITGLASNACLFKLHTWDYQLAPEFYRPDTLAFMSVAPGRYDWNGIEAEAEFTEATGTEWRSVEFSKPFNQVPVVFTTQVSDSVPSATSVRIRRVTEKGFDVCLRYEGAVSPADVPEKIAYLAVEPGSGSVGERSLKVGLTPKASVGDNLSNGYTIEYGMEFAETPLLYAAMQTEEDTITSVLRIKSLNTFSATVFKDRETSVARERVKPEQVGWMVVGHTLPTSVSTLREDADYSYSYETKTLTRASGSDFSNVRISNIQGMEMMNVSNTQTVDLSSLMQGMYIIHIDNSDILKIIIY